MSKRPMALLLALSIASVAGTPSPDGPSPHTAPGPGREAGGFGPGFGGEIEEYESKLRKDSWNYILKECLGRSLFIPAAGIFALAAASFTGAALFTKDLVRFWSRLKWASFTVILMGASLLLEAVRIFQQCRITRERPT